VQARVGELARALRGSGLPVAISNHLDALRATAAVDLLDRRALREALAATLTSSAAHRPAFDTLFDLYFPARSGGGDDPAPAPRDVAEFLAELVARILAGDETRVGAIAREAVSSYGRVESRDGTAAYFVYRVFRDINLAGLLRRLLDAAPPADDPLAQRIARDRIELLLRRFREEVEAEVRRRQAEAVGPERAARMLARPPPSEVDFFTVTAEEQAQMRRAVGPLARRLASRLALRRRRAADGRLDARSTMRRAVSTGGVPLDPVFRAKRTHRPELVVLCDVSGSVAAFARFTLLFCHALQGQFSRVRSFAFIDDIDEVTRLFADGDVGEAMARLSAEATLVRLDGHSDYGHALQAFVRRYGDAVTPRSTVLVLGDARNNYRAANADALRALRERARHLYWLNPEPSAHWGTGDSIAPDYARHCDAMLECRNLAQLSAFIEGLARPHR